MGEIRANMSGGGGCLQSRRKEEGRKSSSLSFARHDITPLNLSSSLCVGEGERGEPPQLSFRPTLLPFPSFPSEVGLSRIAPPPPPPPPPFYPSCGKLLLPSAPPPLLPLMSSLLGMPLEALPPPPLSASCLARLSEPPLRTPDRTDAAAVRDGPQRFPRVLEYYKRK